MASNDELACVYAALILADDKVAITGDKITTLTKAANVSVESYWPDLFASALADKDINDLLLAVSAGGGGGGAAAPAAGGEAAAPAAEAAKEEEEEEESDEEMGFDLFD
mmetsp:Transcript_23282/g.39544  ORF Transcript_23282/g.39544 Transcript_23282/m.39544 type:complete len:109 (-) Transcript_23282:55-381(-)|eukprot:CAMPEP_0168584052 /NCGR_PEP_ID=MMETSP0420-20121227/2926_1 /TAXON_ID=498008 /ORGANISM="Pessonella sp." /LENGTH=108 /DNA_ID=CAMNT_0008618813 /DNA_START=53 /DNA_END=379 /DNA_ORIENTATION=-